MRMESSGRLSVTDPFPSLKRTPPYHFFSCKANFLQWTTRHSISFLKSSEYSYLLPPRRNSSNGKHYPHYRIICIKYKSNIVCTNSYGSFFSNQANPHNFFYFSSFFTIYRSIQWKARPKPLPIHFAESEIIMVNIQLERKKLKAPR